MLNKLSQRDRRALLGLAGFVGLMALIFLVILPYWETQEEVSQGLEAKQAMLERSVEALKSRETYLKELEELERIEAQVERHLLEAPNANQAKTQLLNILNDLAAQAEVTMSRVSDVPERVEGDYVRITKQINLEGDIRNITEFLQAVAEHEKFLKVEELTLNIGRSRRNQTVPLRPRLKIYGLVRLS